MDKVQKIRKWLDKNLTNAPENLEEKIRAKLVAKPHRLGLRTWRWAFAATTVTAVAIVIGLSAPRYALARTLRQVHAAIVNAHSMRVDFYWKEKGVADRLYSRTWYHNGDWRQDCRLGTLRETSFIWLQSSNQYWTWYPQIKTATVQGLDEANRLDPPDGNMDALEYAKKITDSGPSNLERKVRILPGTPIKGRSTFRIVAERNDGNERDGNSYAEITVDSETNLPIEAVIETKPIQIPGMPKSSSSGVFRFTFFDNPDASVFKLNLGSDTRVINLPEEWARLRNQWSKPIHVARDGNREIEVCDVRFDPNGDVTLIYRGDTRLVKGPFLPDTLQSDMGTHYIRVPADVTPGTYDESPAGKALGWDGKTVVITRWTPLEPYLTEGVSPTLTFSFADRSTGKALTQWKVKPSEDQIGDLNDLGVVCGLEWEFCLTEMTDASTRGRYYFKERKDYASALRWFRKANELSKQISPRSHPTFLMSEIIECLEALGRTGEANDLRRRYGLTKKPRMPGHADDKVKRVALHLTLALGSLGRRMDSKPCQ